MGRIRRWSEEEDVLLIEQYGIVATDRLAAMLQRSNDAVRMRAITLGLKHQRTVQTEAIQHTYFQYIDSYEQAYILGLLTADGNMSTQGVLRLVLHEQDKSLVEWVRDRIAPKTPVRLEGNAVVFCVRSQQLQDDLARYGIIANKTYTSAWPIALPVHLSRSFMLGLFDGDGSLYYAKRKLWNPSLRWALYGTESTLASAAQLIEQATNIRPYGPRHVRKENAGYAIELACNKAKEVDNWLNQDGMGLPRKHL